MSYHFPLSPVLWLRGTAEEREERLLQNIHQEIALTAEQLNTATAEIAASEAGRGREVARHCSGIHLHTWYEHLEELRQRRKELEERMEKLEELRAKQMIAYQAARRDREMLDELHNQKRAAYEADAARREQSRLDDTFGAQYARGLRGGVK
jgi:flagellar export protein FliJ